MRKSKNNNNSNYGEKIVVSIVCETYNQSKYIRQTIEGFLIQIISFKYEILIHDDASFDGTAEIIKHYENRYPKLIYAIYQKENQYSTGVKIGPSFQYPRVRGKYVAFCEGDDYWTDPYKLQKQIDFLEKNKQVGLVYTKAWYYYQSSNKFARRPWGGSATSFTQLIKGNRIPTLTAVYRIDLCKQYYQEIQPESKQWKMGDFPMFLYFSLKAKVHFMNEVTGVYRVLDESMSHTKCLHKREAFIRSTFEIKKFFLSYARIEFNEQKIQDLMYSSLASNALHFDDRQLALGYIHSIKKSTIRVKLKKIVFNSKILTSIYMLHTKFKYYI